MRTSVEASLEQFDRFATIASGNRRAFVQKVVERSDGVFLWIKLVIYKLRDILERCGTLEDLHETLNHLPKDLELLFAGMLMSIPQGDQHEAWAVLAVLMAASRYSLLLYIFDYSLVKGCLERHEFEEDPFLTPMTKTQIIVRKKKFALHVNRLLKGIIELTYNSVFDNLNIDDLLTKRASEFAFEERLNITHRSIYEHLEHNVLLEIKCYMDSLEVQTIVLRCMIRCLTKVQLDESIYLRLYWIVRGYLNWTQNLQCEDVYRLLAIFDNLLLHFQGAGTEALGIDWSVAWTFVDLMTVRLRDCGMPFSVLAISFELGVHQYINWLGMHPSAALAQKRTGAELCKMLFNFGPDSCRQTKLLVQLTNDAFISSRLLNFEMPLDIPTEFFCRIEPANLGSSEFKRLNTNYTCLSKHGSTTTRIAEKTGKYRTLKPKMSLRELIEWWNPDNRSELLRLIDWNLAREEEKEACARRMDRGVAGRQLCLRPYQMEGKRGGLHPCLQI
ncbi:uncharacterized protein RAG0_00071 [Rhynchosporium agropyri]|uniref:Uncharacterized protein n=1 Tax=Rhynchosporium agropyri TaxID=914238 RepID=A0A1E1JRS4_9HELO|nr:uncharacterized protein RAG0_00071 [Rhynchosporium agropyri]